ncbi:Hypothetical predicted protein [Cloeon dipterum]|uniref:Uncharacterized protein n=1 Tax=Cloeon dipterum TaxID=197152 RepID=A0A8S1BXE7_9INSE|nr:Hypothetical predicted protein [Cloeon dipterum]
MIKVLTLLIAITAAAPRSLLYSPPPQNDVLFQQNWYRPNKLTDCQVVGVENRIIMCPTKSLEIPPNVYDLLNQLDAPPFESFHQIGQWPSLGSANPLQGSIIDPRSPPPVPPLPRNFQNLHNWAPSNPHPYFPVLSQFPTYPLAPFPNLMHLPILHHEPFHLPILISHPPPPQPRSSSHRECQQGTMDTRHQETPELLDIRCQIAPKTVPVAPETPPTTATNASTPAEELTLPDPDIAGSKFVSIVQVNPQFQPIPISYKPEFHK